MKSISPMCFLAGKPNKLRMLVLPLILFFCMLHTATYASPGICAGVTMGPPSCSSSFVADHPGGTWSSSNESVVTVDVEGNITAIGGGTATITYTYTTECGTLTYHYSITVDPPTAIIGIPTVCVGKTTILSASPTGGTWTSSNAGVATVSSGGVVTGVAAGTAVISYTLGSTGCTTTRVVTVNALPVISAGVVICAGASATLSATPSGGTWTTGDTGVATVDPSLGVVTGVSGGIATITYTASSTLCQTTTNVTVSAVTVSGADVVCESFTTTLTATAYPAAPAGTWSSSNMGVATVSTAGVVTGIASGTTLISYTLPNGCYGTRIITVGATLHIQVCQTLPFSNCDTAVTYGSSLQLTIHGVPPGVTPAWSYTVPATPVPAGVDDVVYSFTMAPTATRTYTVNISNLGCTAQDIVTIVVPPASGCSPYDQFKPVGCTDAVPFKTIYGPPLTSTNVSTVTPGYYYIVNTNVSPTVTATYTLGVSPASGSVFVMDKNVKLNVTASGDITLDHCHFMSSPSCPWLGIDVATNASSSGKLKLINNTLIEHSGGNAVALTYTLTTTAFPSTSDTLIKSDGAIYNQNKGYGINVAASHPTYPITNTKFIIKNSVFTSRDFTSYHSGEASCNYDPQSYYPFSWPAASGLKTQTSTSDNYPAYSIDTYPVVTPTTNKGVGLTLVGTANISTFVFNSITIGDSANETNSNLFDTLSTGCYVFGSSAIFHNNIFRGANKGIDGLFQNPGTIQMYQGSTANTHNRFYDCFYGVYSMYCNRFISKNTVMGARNTNSPLSVKGSTGFYVGNNGQGKFDNHILESNVISNYKYGIQLVSQLAGAYCNGNVYIRKNSLTGLHSKTGSEHAYIGIEFNIVGCNDASEIHMSDNDISGYAAGLWGYTKSQKTYIDSNEIELIKTPVSSAFKGGILLTYWLATNKVRNTPNTIKRNHIYGDTLEDVSYNSPAPAVNTTNYTMDGYTGIKIEKTGSASMVCTVSCNYVHDLPIGFNFIDTSYLDWKRNVMARNSYGMILQMETGSGPVPVAARIGNQGSACNPGDNYWDTMSAGWAGWNATSGPWQTYTRGEDPGSQVSKLFVRSAPGYLPFANGTGNTTISSTTYTGVAYVATTTLDTTCGGTIADLVQCGPFYADGGNPAGRPAYSSSYSEMTDISHMTDEGYTIFPNPAEDNISIRSGSANDGNIQVNIRNYASASVYSGNLQLKNGTASVKLPNVVPGVYMVEVRDERGAARNYKLVIQQR